MAPVTHLAAGTHQATWAPPGEVGSWSWGLGMENSPQSCAAESPRPAPGTPGSQEGGPPTLCGWLPEGPSGAGLRTMAAALGWPSGDSVTSAWVVSTEPQGGEGGLTAASGIRSCNPESSPPPPACPLPGVFCLFSENRVKSGFRPTWCPCGVTLGRRLHC